jgi:hypothetical protein
MLPQLQVIMQSLVNLQGAAQPISSAITDAAAASELAGVGDPDAADAAGYAADGVDSSVTAAANRAIATGLVSRHLHTSCCACKVEVTVQKPW